MKNVVVSLGIAAALALAPAVSQASTLEPPMPFIVFGDSLSDAGIFGGQETNGQVWAAQLGATTTGVSPTYNFAQGSARAVKGGDAPSGFDEQITVYDLITPAVDADTHAVVWLGGNDLLAATQAALASGFDPATPDGRAAARGLMDATGAQAVAAIGDGIERLTTLSRDPITRFVVAGLPSLDLLPAFAWPSLAPLAGTVNAATSAFNTALQAEMATLNARPELTVRYVDVAAIFADIIANAPGNGFTNLQGDCLDDGAFPVCAGYVFADSLHPSEASHTILARAFAAHLPGPMMVPAPVPLPAGVLLALAGLGALGALRLARVA